MFRSHCNVFGFQLADVYKIILYYPFVYGVTGSIDIENHIGIRFSINGNSDMSKRKSKDCIKKREQCQIAQDCACNL